MATFRNFRGALNGFNREDVVSYIEYMNNKHASQVNQLNTEISALRQEVETLQARPVRDPAMEEELEALRAEREALVAEAAALREELAATRAELEESRAAANRPKTDGELEAYRRAERAERIAAERVAQLYDQANGVLADATARTDDLTTRFCGVSDRIFADMNELQVLLAQGRNSLKDAATAMYTIRPATPEE